MIYFLAEIIKSNFQNQKILAAFFYILVVTLFVLANKSNTAGNAILLQYTAPVYVALFGYGFLKKSQ